MVLQAQPVEGGAVVAGGGVQQQADRQVVAGPGAGRPGDAVADRAAARSEAKLPNRVGPGGAVVGGSSTSQAPSVLASR